MFEGYSKTMAFYGDGSWYGAEADNGASGYRLINWGVIGMGDSCTMPNKPIMLRLKPSSLSQADITEPINTHGKPLLIPNIKTPLA